MTTTMTDEELFFAGDIDELCKRHSENMLDMLFEQWALDAFAAMEETWATLRRDGVNTRGYRGCFNPEYRFRPWLFSMALNIAMNHRVTRKRLKKAFSDIDVDIDELVPVVNKYFADRVRQKADNPVCVTH